MYKNTVWLDCRECGADMEIEMYSEPGDPSVGIRGPVITDVEVVGRGCTLEEGYDTICPMPDEYALIERLYDEGEPEEAMQAAYEQAMEDRYEASRDY